MDFLTGSSLVLLFIGFLSFLILAWNLHSGTIRMASRGTPLLVSRKKEPWSYKFCILLISLAVLGSIAVFLFVIIDKSGTLNSSSFADTTITHIAMLSGIICFLHICYHFVYTVMRCIEKSVKNSNCYRKRWGQEKS